MREDPRGLGRDQIRVVATGGQPVGTAHHDDRQKRQPAFAAPLHEWGEEPAEIARRAEPEFEGEVSVGDALAPPGEPGQEPEGDRAG